MFGRLFMFLSNVEVWFLFIYLLFMILFRHLLNSRSRFTGIITFHYSLLLGYDDFSKIKMDSVMS